MKKTRKLVHIRFNYVIILGSGDNLAFMLETEEDAKKYVEENLGSTIYWISPIPIFGYRKIE